MVHGDVKYTCIGAVQPLENGRKIGSPKQPVSHGLGYTLQFVPYGIECVFLAVFRK